MAQRLEESGKELFLLRTLREPAHSIISDSWYGGGDGVFSHQYAPPRGFGGGCSDLWSCRKVY